MKAKIFLSSILTIALCLSLIVGSTFALFETEKTVNIAVTAGKVGVSAHIPDTIVKNLYVGDATYNSTTNELSVTDMLPGDKVSFDIEVANNSNVPLKYKVSASSAITSGTDLLDALSCKVTVNGTVYTMNASSSGFATDYISVPAPATEGAALTTINVVLEFPADNTSINYNDFQGAGTKIAFTVEAVQGNGDTTNP